MTRAAPLDRPADPRGAIGPVTDGGPASDDPHVMARSAAHPVKPRLRGWLHAGAAPLASAAGVVLVCLAPTGLGRVGGAVFGAGALLLFGTSGVYHRFSWGRRTEAVLRRMDHANIFVFIAATYTPVALLLLDGAARTALLCLVWGAAAVGVAFRLLWLSAPRLLYTALYVVVGWSAIGWLGPLLHTGGPAVFALILAGGLCYTAGAVVYATRRPDPWPRWFGFHEIFHAGTIAGFVCHYTAISLASYAAAG